MALNGSYELSSDEGHLAHMVAIGFPEDLAKDLTAKGKSIKITINGDDVTIDRGSDGKASQHFKLNQEFEESAFGGKPVKSKATLNGNELTVVTNGSRGDWKRTFSASGSELTLTLSTTQPGVPDGKLIYKKL